MHYICVIETVVSELMVSERYFRKATGELVDYIINQKGLSMSDM